MVVALFAMRESGFTDEPADVGGIIFPSIITESSIEDWQRSQLAPAMPSGSVCYFDVT